MAMSKEQPLLLIDLVAHTNQVPARFIRPISDRPNLHEVDKSDTIIPLIDLDGFSGSNPSQIIKEIGQACQTHGFFLVKNHGIEECIINDMLRVSKEFFLLSESERLKNYSSDPLKTTRLSTSFNVNKESISSWRDYLRLHCYPLEDYVHEWPSNPPSFRETVGKYCTNVRGLVLKLLEAISESLGLEKGYMEKALCKQAQHMAINYYPPCPQPELTCGLPAHKDPNALTVLLQDQVPGLQVLSGGKWVTVKPIPGTFVVNIGDQKQVDKTGSRENNMMPFAVGRRICRALNLAGAYRTSPFPYFFGEMGICKVLLLLLIFLLTLNPVIIEATRPWAGAASPPLRENTSLQTLEKAPVERLNHSSCSYIPAVGGKCPTSTVHGTGTARLP